MKKLQKFISVILICLLLASCNNAVDHGENTTDGASENINSENTTNEENTTDGTTTGDGSTEETTTDDNDVEPKPSKLNNLIHDDKTLSGNGLKNDDTEYYKQQVFTNPAAPKTRSVELFGVEHTLTYLRSGLMSYSGIPVDQYTVDDIENAWILFLADSDQVVRYENIPLPKVYESEQEYKDLIRSLIPADMDISNYEYFVETRYDDIADDSTKNENKFVYGEGVTNCSYTFRYYDKLDTYDNVYTGNLIYFYVYANNKIYMDMWSPDYDREIMQKTFDEFFSAGDELQNFIFSRLKENYTPIEIYDLSYNFYIRDGVPFIVTSGYIKYSWINSSGVEKFWDEYFIVITHLNSDQKNEIAKSNER